ncbi:MAG: ABC transporter substrate-binding protein [Desmonostoc geniculatum HA4340-LM1]|jgi:ABC-type branched-subunit amino acid transport system substrate-binding protein|nr:ABC transporter substrate-binding protein [Desmonostoc geniculatum HA4340-LM1]
MSPNSQNPYRINPYIIGNPIVDKDKLFGRETLLKTIEDSLQQKAKFILLHGQRRIGKSSLLKNIPLFISQDEFVFVPCDLQHHSDSTLGQILYAIANSIVETLQIDSAILNSLDTQQLNNNPKIFTRRLLPRVYDTLGDKKKLVFLLDEFDVVTQDNTPQALKLLEFLQKLVTQEEELFVIAVVARYLKFMPNLVQLFREAPFQEIGLLDDESAKKLITQPAATTLQYPKKTIDEILKFSAGHPYYTQVLCYVIFGKARDESYSTITSACVNDAVNIAIERGEGGSASIWEGLSISEKVVILAVAKAQEQNASENPLKVVEAYGLVLTDSLKEAIDLLINKGFLDSNPLKVKVELVRLWLLQRYQLRVEVRSLETLQQENVNRLLFVACNCWAENRQQDALDIYEQALKENPNHFGTVVELAEKYLQVKNFDRDLELYERAYKLDPTTYQQQFVNALHEYGHFLITQINYLVAAQQYERILKIQPDNNLAQDKLAEIRAYQANNKTINNNYIINRIRENSRSVIVIFIGLIIASIGGMVLGHYLFSNCPGGQEKSLDGGCIPSSSPPRESPTSNNINNRISRGDRTLFPDIQNSDRDNGIESFKKGNYTDAAKHFEKAVKNNRNDPEVLIYQNNALARQKGNPLILAVVVPAQRRTNSAQEILRGVAQAQNQFNQQNGLQGRLVEIVIADDDNNEDTAKRIADELVKDESILGVIGHGSSKVTNAALSIYTKANLAIVSSTSTSIDLRGSVFFRILPSDKATGEKLAKYALKNNFKKIVIFCNPVDPYSRSIKEEFRFTFVKNQREEVVPSSCINLADPNLDVAQEVKNLLNDPLVEAIALFPDTDKSIEVAMDIAKTYNDSVGNLRKSNNNVEQLKQIKVLAGDSLYKPEVANTLKDLILAVPWFRDAPKSRGFAQKAENQWGGGVSWRTATSFDATQAFIESFKLSPKVSRVTVLENLPKINISESTSGEQLKFDSSREINKPATLIMVEDGRFVNAE